MEQVRRGGEAHVDVPNDLTGIWGAVMNAECSPAVARVKKKSPVTELEPHVPGAKGGRIDLRLKNGHGFKRVLLSKQLYARRVLETDTLVQLENVPANVPSAHVQSEFWVSAVRDVGRICIECLNNGYEPRLRVGGRPRHGCGGRVKPIVGQFKFMEYKKAFATKLVVTGFKRKRVTDENG